jgi:hypothetical protein
VVSLLVRSTHEEQSEPHPVCARHGKHAMQQSTVMGSMWEQDMMK